MAAKSCSRASAEFGRSRIGGNDLSSQLAGVKRQNERESLSLATKINHLWRQKQVSQWFNWLSVQIWTKQKENVQVTTANWNKLPKKNFWSSLLCLLGLSMRKRKRHVKKPRQRGASSPLRVFIWLKSVWNERVCWFLLTDADVIVSR